MDLGLSEKVFVVGGGSKGLGRGIAQALVAEGARVLLVSRDEESLDRAVAALGPAARAVAADMAYPGTGSRLRTRSTRSSADGSTACWSTLGDHRPGRRWS